MWKSFLVVNVFRCSSVSNGFKMSLWAPRTFGCGVLTPDVPSASRCEYPGLFMFNPFGILPQKTFLSEFVLCFPPVRQPVGGSAVPDPKGWKGGMWKSFLVVNVFRCSSVSNGFKMSLWAPHTFWCGVFAPDVPSASRGDYPGLFMFNPFGILLLKNPERVQHE